MCASINTPGLEGGDLQLYKKDTWTIWGFFQGKKNWVTKSLLGRIYKYEWQIIKYYLLISWNVWLKWSLIIYKWFMNIVKWINKFINNL